jgi:2-polyprenyl-3-methyl-5-hydroxy-6-metoxy-1,4-benzoquinol methylase
MIGEAMDLTDDNWAAGKSDPNARIYDKYLSSGAGGLVPVSLHDLTPRLPYLTRIVSTFFPPDRRVRVLDLGCGHGALLYAAHKQGYLDLTGIDSSAEQVAAAHALGIQQVQQSDLFNFLNNQTEACFDIVVTFDVMEHLSKSRVVTLVDEIRRILKPAGRWIIHVPNAESPFFGRIRYGDFTHEMAFTRKSIMDLLNSSDFVDVQCFEDPIVPHGIRSFVRFILWKMIRVFLKGYMAIETGDTKAIFTQNFLAVAYPARQRAVSSDLGADDREV